MVKRCCLFILGLHDVVCPFGATVDNVIALYTLPYKGNIRKNNRHLQFFVDVTLLLKVLYNF